MINVYLLLGSNLGNRQAYLQQAVVHIETDAGHVVQQSGVYETQSWGKTNLPAYLNQVILIQTELLAQQLLNKLLQIELLLGRTREEKWGSRTVDIDILFYGNEVINLPQLTIPHPELHNRRFTLEPLAEIAPNLVHPVLQLTVKTLLFGVKDKLQVKKYIFE